MKMTWKQMLAIVAAIASLSGLVTTAFAVERHFAKDERVDKIEVRILQNEYYNLQDRKWKIEDRFIGQSIPQDVKDRLREIKRQMDQIQLDIEAIKKG